MGPPFQVKSYSIDMLRRILSEKAGTPQETVDRKTHSVYFESYFKELKARTILIENDYVDRDFLEDFAGYYVRCFHEYRRWCTRLHFFNRDFTQDDMDTFLRGSTVELTVDALQESYLGFVVVKPLPQTVIGRTCLRTYDTDSEHGRREYPVKRTYKANLYGIPLEVETLAFQEQDRVVAACATSALWSAFHGTGKLFQHAIPSPVEITKAATAILPLETRSFPNPGLTAAQMAQGIRNVGLEPLMVAVPGYFSLRTILYAYLRGRIPVIMTVVLYDLSGSRPQRMGLHAVTVTGYGLIRDTPKSLVETGFVSRACRIDRIYAHDDQVGPYARMKLDGIDVHLEINGNPCAFPSLSTSWKNRCGQLDRVRAIPEAIFVPLYHKIRIKFSTVRDQVIHFDACLESLRSEGKLRCAERIVWDLYLIDVRTLKSELFSSKDFSGDSRRAVLLRGLPRFLWRGTALSANKPVFDLLFDATDIEQGKRFVRAIEYDPVFCAVVRATASSPALQGDTHAEACRAILEWFKNPNGTC